MKLRSMSLLARMVRRLVVKANLILATRIAERGENVINISMTSVTDLPDDLEKSIRSGCISSDV